MAIALDGSSPAGVFNDTAGTTSLVTASFTPPSGSVVVAIVGTGDANTTSTTPTGLTFTSRINIGTGNSSARLALYTAIGGGSSVTVTAAFGGGSNVRGLGVFVFTGAQLAASPAVHTSAAPASGAPSDTITTVAANSIVVFGNIDWAAIDGTTRTYRSSATELSYHFVSGQITSYRAYQAAASAGSQTYGLTAPTGQTYVLGGIEIQDSGGGAPAIPPSLIMQTRRAF